MKGWDEAPHLQPDNCDLTITTWQLRPDNWTVPTILYTYTIFLIKRLTTWDSNPLFYDDSPSSSPLDQNDLVSNIGAGTRLLIYTTVLRSNVVTSSSYELRSSLSIVFNLWLDLNLGLLAMAIRLGPYSVRLAWASFLVQAGNILRLLPAGDLSILL